MRWELPEPNQLCHVDDIAARAARVGRPLLVALDEPRHLCEHFVRELGLLQIQSAATRIDELVKVEQPIVVLVENAQ